MTSNITGLVEYGAWRRDFDLVFDKNEKEMCCAVRLMGNALANTTGQISDELLPTTFIGLVE